MTASSNQAPLPRRPYRETGIELSIVGMGGIVIMGNPQDRCNSLVAEFFERGVNYFDVAPQYGEGEAEIKLGPALQPYRKEAFLACKTLERTAEGARYELYRSLSRLKTDYFDLYQLHSLADLEKDVDTAFGKGGAMEPILRAKKEGRIRYLGFSAHSEEAAIAAMDRYDFDSVLFPLNFANVFEGGFGPRILKRAKEKGLACLALKGMARQQWREDDPRKEEYSKVWYEPLFRREDAELALRYTLSHPIVAAIPPGIESLFRMALEIAENLTPLSVEEEERLRTMASGLRPVFEATA